MKKGISLVVLAVSIIVLIILVGVIVFNANFVLVDAGKVKLQSDIAQLEYLMNTYKIRNNGNIGFNTVEFNVADMSSDELEQFNGENIVNNKINLFVIDLNKIDVESVNYGNLKNGTSDRYLYSLNTGKVYYELGLEVKGVTYYRIEKEEK